jgi:glycine betaine/proline transport system permease protein
MTADALPLVGRRTAAIDQRRLLWLGLLVVVAVLYLLFQDQWTLPHDDDRGIFRTIDDIRDWLNANRDGLGPISVFIQVTGGVVGAVADGVIGALVGIGWPAVVAAAAFLGYAAGGWRVGVLAPVGLLLVGALGLWDIGMQTLGLTLAAVLFSLLIGIPIGIAAGRSDRVRAVVTPILDVMQIMPTFAYLAPFALLYGIGAGPAAIVTLVYAAPAAIRITALGIRGVPVNTIEAAESLGSTGRQVLTKVQIPLSLRAIGLAVNQTIMLALSMVVVTVLIAAPGLGGNLISALNANNVGVGFDAGIAVVLLAIVIDRVTEHAGLRLDGRSHPASAGRRSRIRVDRRIILAVLGALTVIAIGIGVVAGDTVGDFPTDVVSISFRQPVNALVDGIQQTFGVATSGIKDAVTVASINPLEHLLTTAPFWLVALALAAVGWLLSGMRAAIWVLGGLLLVAALQLWEHAMQTLVLVVVGTVITMLIGLVLGILAARSRGFSSVLRPLLDFAQTMPSFVYLLPAVALFGVGRFTGIVAAVIFAVPPVVRLVEAGIRLVPPTTIEAATAAGSSSGQLLWKVQLPLARPALMLALNQGIVMVLGMVVVAALVGAGALGYDVIAGFSQVEDFGKGFCAGITLVLLGIVLDRMSQGAGRRTLVKPGTLPRRQLASGAAMGRGTAPRVPSQV